MERRALLLRGLAGPLTAAAGALFGGCASWDRTRGAGAWKGAELSVRAPDATTRGNEIVFRRRNGAGVAWTSWSVRLPYVTGPGVQLHVRRGHMIGHHEGGGLSITVSPTTVTGWGPGGTIEMDVSGDAPGLRLTGLWNGERGLLEASDEGLHVLAAARPMALAGARPIAPTFSSFTFARKGEGYFVGEPGEGTWLETTLQIQPGVSAALRREEIATLLLVLLSQPPV